MARKDISTLWDRDMRTAINENFKELYNEYIGAGLNAAEAREKALSAVMKSDEAMALSERTQKELSQAILEGDSSPLGGQLSVGADGTVYSDPQDRFVKEMNSVNQNLAQNISYTDFSFSSLSSRKKERRPLVSFISDDGGMGDWNKLKPILEEKNISVGLGIITSRVGTSGYMTYEQIREMENMGCEIMSHTHTHPNLRELNEDQIDNEVYRGYIELVKNGFQPKGFIYPYNADNETTRRIVRRYFNSGGYTKTEITHQGRNYIDFNNQWIKRVALGSYFDQANNWDDYPQDTSSLEYYKWRVGEALENNNWLVFVLHPGPTNETQLSYLSEIIDYIKQKNIPILNPSLAFDIYSNIIDIRGDKGDFIVDSEGRMIGAPYSVATEPNQYSALDKIDVFPKNAVTSTFINSLEIEGLPANIGGILTTYRLGNQIGYEKQEFRPFDRNEIWTRKVTAYGDNVGDWGEWLLVILSGNETYSVLPVSDLGKYTTSTSLSEFPNHKITTFHLNTVNSTGTPNNEPGIITTFRLGGQSAYGKQEFRPYNKAELWMRTGRTSGDWGEWAKIGG